MRGRLAVRMVRIAVAQPFLEDMKMHLARNRRQLWEPDLDVVCVLSMEV
jgi:hypothetical protein